MGDPYVSAAVAAAVEVGNRFHLPTEYPEVLATRSNVLVRLGAIVARVPGTTLIARPGVLQSLAREVALSSFLDMRDGPVIPPFESPGPHLANELPVTLWRFTRHDRDHVFSPAEVAWSLAELHDALRDFPDELDAPGPLAEARSWVSQLGLPAARDLRAPSARPPGVRRAGYGGGRRAVAPAEFRAGLPAMAARPAALRRGHIPVPASSARPTLPGPPVQGQGGAGDSCTHQP